LHRDYLLCRHPGPGSRDTILALQLGPLHRLLLSRADPLIPREIHNVIDPYLNRLESELQPDASPTPAARGGGKEGG